jgi:hypothetical protein
MTITTTGGGNPVVRVNSTAKSGTLPAQGSINPDQILLDTSLTAVNNGTITAPMIGRLLILRRGAATEETKQVVAGGDGDTLITVHEAWTVVPASGDTYDVAYVFADAAILTGFALSSKTGVYEASRAVAVGTSGGGAFAYFCQKDQEALEIRDSATNYGLVVETNGRFDCGFLISASPGAGGLQNTINDGTGEPSIQMNSGSQTRFRDVINFSYRAATNISASRWADVDVRSWKVVRMAHDFLMAGTQSYRDVTCVSAKTTTNVLKIAQSTTIDNWTLVGSSGFDTVFTEAETLTLNRVTFRDNLRKLTVRLNKTFNVVDPVWTVNTGSQNDIRFFSPSGVPRVNELFSLAVTTVSASGAPISGSAVWVYAGVPSKSLSNSGSTSPTGQFTTNVLVRSFTSGALNLLVTQSSDHALKVYRYGFRPFVAAATFDSPQVARTTLVVDPNVVAGTGAAAISAGAGILPIFHGTGALDVRPMKVLHYTGGTGTSPARAQPVSGASSTARGATVETRFGTAVEGFLVLSGWNGTEFTNGETIGNSFGWSATADLSGGGSSFYQAYTWEYNCNLLSLQTAYDYDRGKTGTVPSVLESIWRSVIAWGEEEQSNLIYSTGDEFFSERNISLAQGVWFASNSAGTISYLTSDAGVKFIPPVQYTFTLTGLQTDTEVRVYNATTDVELAGTESSGTTFSYPYVYAGDIDIYVVIFHLNYRDIRLTGLTLSNDNQSIPVQQQFDRVFQV